MPHVTIIGGGITGLATAFYLQKKSQEVGNPISYTLLEQDSRFGGKIVTTTADEFVIEGGPDSFVTTKPWGTQLCRDLGLEKEIIPTNDHKRNIYVLKKGKLVPFPGGYRLSVPTEFIPFALSPLISPLGKLRIGLDLFIPPRQEEGDESLGSFFRRRLGAEALDRIAEPIMAGIYSAKADVLSMQSTFPQFIEMEKKHGSLIKAMRHTKKAAPPRPAGSKPSPMFTSLRGGMNTLVEGLTGQLRGDLCPGSPVTGLQYRAPGFEVRLPEGRPPLITDAVVLTTPAYVTAPLVNPLEPELGALLRQIRYISTGNISLGYRWDEVKDQHSFNGFGFVVPKSEKRPIVACTWSSTKFDHRAPEDDILVRVFVGGEGKEEVVGWADEDLIRLAQAELAALMGIKAQPVVAKIFRWNKASPQYEVGHLNRVAKMEALAQKIPGLYLSGSAFRGVGIPDCVKSALTTVDQLLDYFHNS
jgi:protoporphyrinogen/coproporphyrinogen III oxidase